MCEVENLFQVFFGSALMVLPASVSESWVRGSPVGLVGPGVTRAMGSLSLHWLKPTMADVALYVWYRVLLKASVWAFATCT